MRALIPLLLAGLSIVLYAASRDPLPHNFLRLNTAMDLPVFVDIKEPIVKQGLMMALLEYECLLDGFHWHYSAEREGSLVVTGDIREGDEWLWNNDAAIAEVVNQENLIAVKEWMVADHINWDHVFVHELGHLLGLPHSEDQKSAMYFSRGLGLNQFLTAEDRLHLKILGHPTRTGPRSCNLPWLVWPEHTIFPRYKLPRLRELPLRSNGYWVDLPFFEDEIDYKYSFLATVMWEK